MKSIPVVRMDLLTRKTYPKEMLFRLVLQEGKLTFDEKGSLPGRGIYLKKDKETIEAVFKKKMLLRYGSLTDFEALKKELLRLC